jgi:hypothetical protein
MPQPIARPVDEPHAALVATCECGLRIVRLALTSGAVAARRPHRDLHAARPARRPTVRGCPERNAVSDLVEFLKARLDEDEAVARAAQEAHPGRWFAIPDRKSDDPKIALVAAAADSEEAMWGLNRSFVAVPYGLTTTPRRP